MKNKENITHLVPNICCSKKLKNKKKTKFRDMRRIFLKHGKRHFGVIKKLLLLSKFSVFYVLCVF